MTQSVIGLSDSGVLGGHAVVAGPAAGVLVRLLGDWRREAVRVGLTPELYLAADQAVSALHEASNQASRSGSGEGAGKSSPVTTEAWLTTHEVAGAVGLSPRRIRQLRDDGAIEAVETRGRLQFPPDTPELVRTLRRAS